MDYQTARERRSAFSPDGTKTCFKCGVEKPYAEFYKHPQMADGHLGKCKACTKMDVRSDYEKNLDEKRAAQRERQRGKNLPRDRSEWLKNGGREKRKAHSMVQWALRSGEMVRQPCERCGTTVRVEAHHDDYAKPLDVRWLCPKHHRQHHAGRWID